MATKKYFEEEPNKETEAKQEETVIITKGQYDEYQQILRKLQEEETKSKTWQEKYMEQVSINKKLQEDMQKMNKCEDIVKEAQRINHEKQRLEAGILNLIRNLS